jgi:hypothetical protein
MIEYLKALLFLIGTFTFAIVLASFLSPLILLTIDKITKILTKQPENQADKRKYAIYIPRQIQQIRSLFNLHNRKRPVINSQKVEGFNGSESKPKPQDTPDSIGKPRTKFIVNPINDALHATKSTTGEKDESTKRELNLSE